MSRLTAIGKALDFVEHNLHKEIAVSDMADAAGYSLYHFSRTFNSVVHHTPYDYLMRRRLSESARDLVETDRRIIDVAFDYRFNNPETYSRAFKRMFGLQPYRWRKRTWIDERLLMSRLTLAHVEHMNGSDHLKPVLREKGALHLTGVMSLVGRGRETVAQLWRTLSRQLESVKDGHQGGGFGGYYGIVWYPRGRWERRFFYMAAIEVVPGDVGAVGTAASALVSKTIPAARYAGFVHRGSREKLQLTLDYAYQIWLPKSGESLAGPFEIECYGRELDAAQAGAEWEVLVPI